ncbi:Gag-like protein, partial [Operophtera brumata]
MDKFVIRSSSTPDLASTSSKRPRDEPAHWQHPKRFAIPKPVSKYKETTTSNRFSSLSVDNEASESFKIASRKKASGRVPPIVIEQHEDWTHQKLKDTIDKYEMKYHLEYKGSNRVKIQCYSSDGHQAIKGGLQKDKVSFHTFTRKDEKLPKVVIKGFPGILLDSLAANLETLGFPGALATHIKTMKPAQCPPVLVQLPSGTDMYLERIKSKREMVRSAIVAAKVVKRPLTTADVGVTSDQPSQAFSHTPSENAKRPGLQQASQPV